LRIVYCVSRFIYLHVQRLYTLLRFIGLAKLGNVSGPCRIGIGARLRRVDGLPKHALRFGQNVRSRTGTGRFVGTGRSWTRMHALLRRRQISRLLLNGLAQHVGSLFGVSRRGHCLDRHSHGRCWYGDNRNDGSGSGCPKNQGQEQKAKKTNYARTHFARRMGLNESLKECLCFLEFSKQNAVRFCRKRGQRFRCVCLFEGVVMGEKKRK